MKSRAHIIVNSRYGKHNKIGKINMYYSPKEEKLEAVKDLINDTHPEFHKTLLIVNEEMHKILAEEMINWDHDFVSNQ